MRGQEDAASRELSPVLPGQPGEDTGHTDACVTQDILALVSTGAASLHTGTKMGQRWLKATSQISAHFKRTGNLEQ